MKHKFVIEETLVFVTVAENEAEALARVKVNDPTKVTRVAHQIIITEDEEGN